jgi:hypothetical protein
MSVVKQSLKKKKKKKMPTCRRRWYVGWVRRECEKRSYKKLCWEPHAGLRVVAHHYSVDWHPPVVTHYLLLLSSTRNIFKRVPVVRRAVNREKVYSRTRTRVHVHTYTRVCVCVFVELPSSRAHISIDCT